MAKHNKPVVHPVDEAWLALGAEAPRTPAIDVIDAHTHLWDFSDPPYFAADYARDAAAAGISASFFVDCTMAYREDGPAELEPVGEVAFVRAQAESVSGAVDVAAGIIGWADLTLGDAVAPVLAALEAAGGGRYRGVRTRATYDPDPRVGYGDAGVPAGLLAQDDYRRGVARLEASGRVLDLYVFHTQLHEAAAFARAFPNLPIVLNQMGGPLGVGDYANQREQVFAVWQAGLSDVATCPNVMVKVGGFAISRIAIVKAAGRARPIASTELADICRPWVDHCLGEFGAERCMFGSNFPVDKVAFPLLTLVNAMKLLTERLGPAAQADFFAGVARRVYRL